MCQICWSGCRDGVNAIFVGVNTVIFTPVLWKLRPLRYTVWTVSHYSQLLLSVSHRIKERIILLLGMKECTKLQRKSLKANKIRQYFEHKCCKQRKHKNTQVGIWSSLGCYATCNDNSLPIFRDKLSVLIFKDQEIFLGFLDILRWCLVSHRWGIVTLGCVTSQKGAVLIHFAAETQIHCFVIYIYTFQRDTQCSCTD